jgi:hypothetical protein
MRQTVADLHGRASRVQQFTQMGMIAGKELLALIESSDNHGPTLSFEKERTLQWHDPPNQAEVSG